MNLQSARHVKEFVSVLKVDSQKRPSVLHVPGHGGRIYKVIIRRESGLSVECLLDTGNGEIPCQGNSHGLCYHSYAALEKAAESKGFKVYFCADESKAKCLVNLVHGKAYNPISKQSKVGIWIVIGGLK